MEDTTLQIIEPPTASETSEEPVPEEPIKADQINGVMVLTLLDKIIGAVDQIQLTQTQLEERQQEMDGAVTSIQGELTKLTKAHTTTSNTVNKMLEKVRKVSVNVKTVRQNLEKQAGQIKKLEANEAELLKRRNFKVMIYQEEIMDGPCNKLRFPSRERAAFLGERQCQRLRLRSSEENVETSTSTSSDETHGTGSRAPKYEPSAKIDEPLVGTQLEKGL
ncbi:PREDICTED: polymerase I and transcript release factor-like, partial [Eurypyga helias]|uniref:polymerase I and transcript release factor-like n=1 Tax=Eurypyga helias TaxID=54383 RepID=UPI0005286778